MKKIDDTPFSIKQDPPNKRTIVVSPCQSPERIDMFLAHQLQNITRTKIQAAIEEERIRVRSLPTRASYKVKPGDTIEITYKHPPAPEMLPEPIPLEIVYEDDCIVVINKEAGMVVHPAFGNWTGTLANAVLYHNQSNLKESAPLRAGIVHRLDKNTSGLVIIAKDAQSHFAISKQFANRTVKKEYTAITWNHFKSKEGHIETLIGRSKRNRKIMTCYPIGNNEGKYASTKYKVINEFNGFSLVKLTIQTGRTHQIRVHLRHVGCPILGDETYGGGEVKKKEQLRISKSSSFITNLLKIMKRQALHAQAITFINPCKKEPLYLTTNLPQDMEAALQKIRLLASY